MLRRAMRASGFDTLLPGMLDAGVVYDGYSVGACVACPSLRGIHLADAPEDVFAVYPDARVDRDGLNLIDWYVVPHYRSDHEESALIEGVVEFYEEKSLPYRTLRDGEALIVRDGAIELIGRP